MERRGRTAKKQLYMGGKNVHIYARSVRFHSIYHSSSRTHNTHSIDLGAISSQFACNVRPQCVEKHEIDRNMKNWIIFVHILYHFVHGCLQVARNGPVYHTYHGRDIRKCLYDQIGA